MRIPRKNALEWTVFGLSLALLIAVAGFLAYDIVRGDSSPPQIVVRPGTPTERGDLIELPVVVENQGGAAVENLLVEVTVHQSSGGEGRAELSLPLLPRGASEEGLVTVPRMGAVERVEWRVVGYTLP